MDSRQFGVLLLAVFLAILAPIGNAEEGSVLVSLTTEKSTSNPAATSPAVIPISSTAGSIVPSSTIETSSSTRSEVSAPTAASSTSAPTTPAASSTSFSTPSVIETTTASPANATNNPVTNDHGIRDVSSDTGKCSTIFKATMEKEKDNWILEKAFLVVSGEDSTLTLEQFCNQLQTIMRLDTICNNGKNATNADADDVKVAPIVAGLASMFTSVCSDPKTRLNVTVGDSTPCVEFIRITAKRCSSDPITKAVHVYPTQVLFEEMTRDNCTVLFNTKECIIKALEHNDKCSSVQQTVIIGAITKMTKGLCVPHSANAATSAPAITTPKTPGNAGTNFQVNFFTILPVLLLAFKFY